MRATQIRVRNTDRLLRVIVLQTNERLVLAVALHAEQRVTGNKHDTRSLLDLPYYLLVFDSTLMPTGMNDIPCV